MESRLSNRGWIKFHIQLTFDEELIVDFSHFGVMFLKESHQSLLDFVDVNNVLLETALDKLADLGLIPKRLMDVLKAQYFLREFATIDF